MQEMREIDELAWHRYEQDLKARDRSAHTITAYRAAIVSLSAYLGVDGLFGATAETVTDWLVSIRRQLSPTSYAAFWRRAHAFYTWAEKHEYIDGRSPMALLTQPNPPLKPVAVPHDDDLAAVVATVAKGRDFYSRRDHAIMRVLLLAGTPRCSALTRLKVSDLDLRHDTLTVHDKGGKTRIIPVTPKAAHALTLYLRARAQHPHASKSDFLFIGRVGGLTRNGLYVIIEKRCIEAGVKIISPHKWRHFTTDKWYDNGGSEGEAMALYGWDSPNMAHHYAKDTQARRAQARAKEMNIGDLI